MWPLASIPSGLERAGRVVGPAVGVLGTGETDLAQIQPLVWAMLAISTAGAIVTFAFLVYAVYRFRDPKTRRRRYG